MLNVISEKKKNPLVVLLEMFIPSIISEFAVVSLLWICNGLPLPQVHPHNAYWSVCIAIIHENLVTIIATKVIFDVTSLPMV